MVLLLQPSNQHSSQGKMGEKEQEVGMGCGNQAPRFRVWDGKRFFPDETNRPGCSTVAEITLPSSRPVHGHVKHQQPAHLSCMSTLDILAGVFAKCHFAEPLQPSSKVRAAPKSLLMNSGWEQRQHTHVSSRETGENPHGTEPATT